MLQSLSNMFSGVFGSGRAQSPGYQARTSGRGTQCDIGTCIDQWSLKGELKFHQVHGGNVVLYMDNSVAVREHYNDTFEFEDAVLFSNRPVEVNEVIAVEILETTSQFCGPLKIGFTTINPEKFMAQAALLGRELHKKPNIWLKPVLLHPQFKIGAVVHFVVNYDGIMQHKVDSEELGVFFKSIPISKPLWVILEAYGSVKSVRFVEPRVTFRRNPAVLDANNNSSDLHEANRNGTGRPMRNSLFARRHMDLSPLDFSHLRAPFSPQTPLAYLTPTAVPAHDGLCLICVDRPKNTAFTKCGHLALCYQCAESYLKKNSFQSTRALCPICRARITSILRIYN